MTGEPAASVQRIADSLVSVIEQRDSLAQRVSALREAVWQVANNAPEHEGETDTSYEEWARPFAAAAIAYDDDLRSLPATEPAQPEEEPEGKYGDFRDAPAQGWLGV